jgi:hypothetical protein
MKTPEFVLYDKERNFYLLKTGWTTNKGYARKFSEEAAKAEKDTAAYNGIVLTIMPAGGKRRLILCLD